MIRHDGTGDRTHVLLPAAAPIAHGILPDPASAAAGRLNELVRAHVPFVWRALRRLGLSPADADDATQRVMLVLADRLADVDPGAERAFLSRTLTRMASRAHRTERRHPVAPLPDADAYPHRVPGPDVLLEQRRAREELDALLSEMPFDLRAAFVLFEIEGCTQPEVAQALGVPRGTVASRLRRAREDFARRARRAGWIDEGGGKR